jgi:hypothetical protein
MNAPHRARPHIVVASLLTIGLSPAFMLSAQAAPPSPEARQACMHDAFRLCNHTIPDVHRTAACLRQHAASLSPICRVAVKGGGAVHRGHRRHKV